MDDVYQAAERLLPDVDLVLDEAMLAAERLGAVAANQLRWQFAWGRRATMLRNQTGPLDTAMSLACQQGFVLTRQQALDCGVSNADLRRLLRHEWDSPRRGVFCVVKPSDRDEQQVLAATAAVVGLWRSMVVSGLSAAVMHGLPRLHEAAIPTVTAPDPRDAPTSTRIDDGVRVLHATVPVSDQTTWFGVPITAAARTVVDLGRLGIADGLVAADAALAGDLTTRAELAEAVERCQGWPGVRSARRAVTLADPRSESPLESLIRLCTVDAGLPMPALQAVIRDGAWWCRVDMLWEAERLVLEADGRSRPAEWCNCPRVSLRGGGLPVAL